MKPLNKLERQYVAYWVMNILADRYSTLQDNWMMDCPTNSDKEHERLKDTMQVIVKLSGYEDYFDAGYIEVR